MLLVIINGQKTLNSFEMSHDVYSKGIMIPLKEKISRETRIHISDDLYDDGDKIGFDVNVNYEGTLIYTDGSQCEDYPPYGIQFEIKNDSSLNDSVIKILEKYGVELDYEKAAPYSCVWYNGTDSEMSLITLEEFLKLTGK